MIIQTVAGSSGALVTVKGLPEGYTIALGTIVSAAAPATGVASLTLTTSPTTAVLNVVNVDGGVMDSLASTFVGGDEFRYESALAVYLYSSLAESTIELDTENNEPLRELINVMSIGLAEVHDKSAQLVELVDIDKCPVALLPYLGAMLGFEFPYDLTEALQRNFVRSAVNLYRIKGTVAAMKGVVSRIIAGQGFALSVENEDHIAKTFDVLLNAEDTANATQALFDKVSYLVGVYSPAGMIPTVIIVYFYTESNDSSNTVDNHVTTAITRWSFNQPAGSSRFNTKTSSGYVVSFNNTGRQVLTDR